MDTRRNYNISEEIYQQGAGKEDKDINPYGGVVLIKKNTKVKRSKLKVKRNKNIMSLESILGIRHVDQNFTNVNDVDNNKPIITDSNGNKKQISRTLKLMRNKQSVKKKQSGKKK